MKVPSSIRMVLLLAGLVGLCGLAQAQDRLRAAQPNTQDVVAAYPTSNMPSGSGEASTMTSGVPNLLASNPQPGELGIQTRLTVRPAAQVTRSPAALRVMGASAAPTVDSTARLKASGKGCPTGPGAAVRYRPGGNSA